MDTRRVCKVAYWTEAVSIACEDVLPKDAVLTGATRGSMSDSRSQPIVSVIITTRNRAGHLAVALRSIVEDGSTAETEIIVVDNGSTDSTQEVIAAAASQSRWPIFSVNETRPGQSRARNLGIRVSRGKYILFTDDDVEVAHGWIDSMTAGFEPGVAAVGGRIIPCFLGPCPTWLDGYSSPLTLVDYGTAPFDMRAGLLPIGANMAYDAAVLRARLPEPFDPLLGHRGRAALGGDETFLLQELIKNHRVVYVPDALVLHRIDSKRCQYASVRKSFYQLGFGTARMERLGGADLPSYPRRIIRLLRCLRGAFVLATQNAVAGTADAEHAQREFWAFLWLGLHVEVLFGAVPAISDRLAALLPGRFGTLWMKRIRLWRR